ncbi:MAG: ABC transporter substrate-binding protein [Candidatus Binatia bacterium]
MKNYLFFRSGAVWVFAAFVAAMSAGGLVCAGETVPGWQAEWEKTVKEAKREGQLTLYVQTQLGEVLHNSGFQKIFPGIKLNWVSGPGSDLVPRIMAERRAGKFLVDAVVNFGNTSPFNLYQAKALDPINSVFVLPEVRDESKWFQNRHHYIDSEGKYIFIYMGAPQYFLSRNKNSVGPNEIKSYWDLLNPKWKSQIAAMDPRISGYGSTGARFFYHHPEMGPLFLTRLYKEMNVTLFRDARQGTDWLASGKFALCLCQSAALARAVAQGLPVDFIDPHGFKERPPLGSGGHTMALIQNAPHPNAAKLFINWHLSREGQMDYQRLFAQNPEGIEGSLRTDMPAERVAPRNRIVPGANYVFQWTTDTIDMKPIRQLISDALEEAQTK